jgi:hypothetical protein
LSDKGDKTEDDHQIMNRAEMVKRVKLSER